MTFWIKIHIPTQQLYLFDENNLVHTYPISSGKNGVGEDYGSEKTPRGWHEIYAKIGANAPLNTVFVRREPTGEIYSEELKSQSPDRDWILTRILQLNGLEPGKNQGGNSDSLKRCIYIHGTPDSTQLQIPGSRGCIRMRNADIVALFDCIPEKTKVMITNDDES